MTTKAVMDMIKFASPLSSMHSSHSFETAQEIITRLKFIGTIESGEKLDVRNMRIETNTMFTPVKRMFFGESRDATLAFCSNTIERAFAITYSLAISDKPSDNKVCAHLLRDMNKAIIGLVNIQQTYKDDKMFVCNIETLMESIQAKILDVQQRYPEIYKASLEAPSPALSAAINALTNSSNSAFLGTVNLTPSSSFTLDTLGAPRECPRDIHPTPSHTSYTNEYIQQQPDPTAVQPVPAVLSEVPSVTSSMGQRSTIEPNNTSTASSITNVIAPSSTSQSSINPQSEPSAVSNKNKKR